MEKEISFYTEIEINGVLDERIDTYKNELNNCNIKQCMCTHKKYRILSKIKKIVSSNAKLNIVDEETQETVRVANASEVLGIFYQKRLLFYIFHIPKRQYCC